MYALAAGAAGVGALCFANPAEAKIVYTPAHDAINANGGVFHIDLNHDGIADFGLSNSWYQGEKTYRRLTALGSEPTNEIWMTTTKRCAYSVAAAVPKGKTIGPKVDFFKYKKYGAVMASVPPSGSCGAWLGQSHLQAYLGLKFTIKGKTHFGWARVKVDTDLQQRPFLETLTGYAYETVPGKAIVAGATKGPDDAEPTAAPSSQAPQPATVHALALGARGLSTWRSEEPAAAASPAN